jgi:signal transduction histidine kinase/predicted CoA-binding protein
LFSSLPEDDFNRLCEMVTEVRLPAGEELFTEGSPGDKAYVIKQGEIEILKASGGRNVLVAVRKSGEVIGEMSLLEAAPRFATGRARSDSLLLAISHEQLDHLINTSPSAARAMLFTVTSRLRSTELLLRESEKMAQLGTLTAGIAHELNNPAAAAKRGSNQLMTAISQLQENQFLLAELGINENERINLLNLDTQANEMARHPSDLESLNRSDREAELENWLDAGGIDSGWEIAPILVNLAVDIHQLEALVDEFGQAKFPVVLKWLCNIYSVYSLLAEIDMGSGRIAEIVKSLKAYVYLDQAPIQPVDLHEGLDNTLVMLRHKLKGGVTVKREYDPDLPRIQAYGSELNQVWTNIIDNAIDAMNGQGEVLICTHQEGNWVIVEIEDTGPGISEEIQSKIFSPFYTTKPVGKGTGLGLNITYNIVQKHGGEIKVFSNPGRTIFQVCLPVNFEKTPSNAGLTNNNSHMEDQILERILETTRTIAVVGISAKTGQPNHTVPQYLQSKGYRIIPVNPLIDEVLGERSYPDLLAIQESVDVVLVFRRSEYVPKIVDQAIDIGAKVVWMQEGIINESAAVKAHEAGLEVVMDTCMRATHLRLFEEL